MAHLLRFDPSACFLPTTGLEESDLVGIEYSLCHLRDEACENTAGATDFLLLPEQLLSDYQRLRIDSELGRMLAVTKAMMSEVDRVVIVGDSEDCIIARALLHSCCQPYFNQLSRGERGSRPRIYFEAGGLDSDALQGLLHLLGAHRHHRSTDVDDSWSMIAISKTPTTHGNHFAFVQLRSALSTSCGADAEVIARRMLHIVSGENNSHSDDSKSNASTFFVSARLEQSTPFSAVGLIPAALIGINVMRFLEGATDITAHFRSTRPAENMVLQYAAINHLLELQGKAQVRIVNMWSHAMESAGKWYEQLLVRQLGGMTPVITVSPRDAILCPQDTKRRPQVVHNLTAENVRCDTLPEVTDSGNHEQPIGPMSNLLSAAIENSANELRDAGCPATNMFLPRVDEYYLGQYFQMMMIATHIESRL